MYLARAIHAANALRPKSEIRDIEAAEGLPAALTSQNSLTIFQKNSGQDEDPESRSQSFYDHRSDDRQAVIHSVDISFNHSKHAEQVVKGFRHGFYADDIVFHVAEISTWIDEQISNRRLGPDEKSFLSHIILDMPSSFNHVEKAASVLHTDGNLLAFNPSITQIISIVKIIKHLNLPLVLDSVLELGLNSGGRVWDVRTVIPRALTGKPKSPTGKDGFLITEDKDSFVGAAADLAESDTADKDGQPLHDQVAGMEIVCRPKVGYRVAGGGFLGVWRKMKY